MKRYILQKFGSSVIINKMIVDVLAPLCEAEKGASISMLGAITIFAFDSERELDEITDQLVGANLSMFFLFRVDRNNMSASGEQLLSAFGAQELDATKDTPINIMSEADLQRRLADALDAEDYATAATIRDQLKQMNDDKN